MSTRHDITKPCKAFCTRRYGNGAPDEKALTCRIVFLYHCGLSETSPTFVEGYISSRKGDPSLPKTLRPCNPNLKPSQNTWTRDGSSNIEPPKQKP